MYSTSTHKRSTVSTCLLIPFMTIVLSVKSMRFTSLLAFFALFLCPLCAAQCPNGWKPSAIQPNKCFLVVAQKETWANADKYCQTQNAAPGAHLVSICSAFENSAVDGELFFNLFVYIIV